MRRAAVILALLMLGGCVSDQGSRVNPASAPFADEARANSDDPYKARSMCQDTSIGSEAKTVCY